MLILMLMVMRFVRPVVTSQDHLRRPIAEILEIASGILDHVPPLTHRSVALVVEEKFRKYFGRLHSQITFFFSARISFRDPEIRIQRPRKHQSLHFRIKIQIFLRPKS